VKVSVTEVAGEREVKSAIAASEEIIETASENQPDVQPEISPVCQPEASEQVNEEIPLANEECSSVALNDVTEHVTPPDAPSGHFSKLFPAFWLALLSFDSKLLSPKRKLNFENHKSSLNIESIESQWREISCDCDWTHWRGNCRLCGNKFRRETISR